MSIDYRGTTVLITGASSGIGAELARALAARGADLVLVARRTDRLEATAARLRHQHGVVVHTAALDVGAPDAVRSLRSFIDDHGLKVDSLVNNAGFGMHGDFVDADPGRVDEQIRVNVAALTSITREFLPDLVESGRGILLNVASTAAFQPLPLMAVYGATKAYVVSFTEALAYETRSTGLRVTALCPGTTDTEFFDVVGTDRARTGTAETAEQVAATALRALDRRRPPASVVSGRTNRALAVSARILPRRLVIWLAARLMSSSPRAHRGTGRPTERARL